jgi:hypothetical protein
MLAPLVPLSDALALSWSRNLPRQFRREGRCRHFGVAFDEPQFLPFGRGENLESAPGSAGTPTTHFDEAIERFVVAERIKVGESQSLGARGDRVIDLLRILRNRVLRIVNDEVSLRKEINVTLILLVPRWLTLGSGAGFGACGS